MKILNRFKNLLALLAILVIAIGMTQLGAPLGVAIFFVCFWQLLQIAMTKRRRYGVCLYTTVLSPEQIKEFEEILKGFKDMGGMFKDLDGIAKSEGGFAAIKKLPELLASEGRRVDEIQKEVNKLRKTIGEARHSTGVKWVGNVPFVTDDCAKALSSVLCLQSYLLGDQKMLAVNKDQRTHKKLVELSCEYLGIEQKAGGALSPTDIPLPTIYMPQVIELVFAYGQARQFGTVFPLGAGTVKLPRLLAGEDTFGFLGAGTAGMSVAVAQKEVEATLVTFTANKMGGLIRIPTELEEDTFIALGQFLARYIARQFAKLEDNTMFMADGTNAYANITGIGLFCVNNNTYLHQLGAGKTLVTDATINDFRALRALVNPAILANMAANGQTQAAYYLHPTLESLLVTFNTIGTPLIYIPASNGRPATLDGFPIRWIGVSQANTANAAPNAYMAFFGDLSYWYLGERGAPRVEVSREVFFSTDELAMRALERIDVEAMALDAMATMQLAAS
jgi:HK97 family phage major capsid protein